MIKNIIFDLGEVLLTGDDRWIYSQQTQKLLQTFDIDKLFKGWEAAWPDARDGKISEDRFFTIFLETLNINPDQQTLDSLKRIYRDATDKHGAYPALEILKGKYPLYSITNVTHEWLKYKRDTFDLDQYLKLIISSCEEGIAKPHKEIYQALITKANIKPEESVFVDDLLRNIKAADEMGFKTIHFSGFEQMKSEMAKMGIQL